MERTNSKNCSKKMEFIRLNRFTQSVVLTQLKQINLTVILEVASKKMEYIQINWLTRAVGLT
ncbi:hypothetical protein Goarm_011265 [Gossypium armourianum]|uniref:Uncharacterized protein n=1 Tax=Gossypium armourianum TaxID=34283 RepID=A0A7J9IWB2_9ROSI|nr:hypothetical protein [Gossypium armourianum]